MLTTYFHFRCGCCLTCAKSELRTCGGGQNKHEGQCAKGLACLKTCCKYLVDIFFETIV